MPLCPLPSRPFLSLTTVLGADLISQCFDLKLCLAINSLGQRCAGADSEIIPMYLQMLASIGICPSPDLMFLDSDPSFHKFVECRVSDLVRTGEMKIKTMEILWCPCGIVEVPKSYVHLASFPQFNQITKQNGSLTCRKCRASLKTTKEDVWTYEFPAVSSNIPVYGSAIVQFFSCLRGLSGFRRVVSKSHHDGVLIRLGYQTLNLDVDFFWNMYLDFLVTVHATDIVVILGARTTQQFAQCISLTRKESMTRVQAIIHPRISLQSSSSLVKLSVADFLKLDEASQTIRAFISQGFSWRQSSASLLSTDLYWARMSAHPPIDFHSESKKLPALTSFPQFVRMLNRANVQSGLKKLRAKRILDPQETKLLGAIITPACII